MTFIETILLPITVKFTFHMTRALARVDGLVFIMFVTGIGNPLGVREHTCNIS
jgi:hypothetical protein